MPDGSGAMQLFKCRCLQLTDHLAYFSIQSVRWLFDVVTNYGPGKMNKDKWLTRVVFLETVRFQW
jgi:hypothetical protein